MLSRWSSLKYLGNKSCLGPRKRKHDFWIRLCRISRKNLISILLLEWALLKTHILYANQFSIFIVEKGKSHWHLKTLWIVLNLLSFQIQNITFLSLARNQNEPQKSLFIDAITLTLLKDQSSKEETTRLLQGLT